MRINRLLLDNFRNYREVILDCDPGVNLIVGDNAQGKTNLLEAISYLGSGKSFRAQKTAEMVRFGHDVGEILANIHSQEREQVLRWILYADGKPRLLFLNSSKKKSAGQIAGVFQTVLFCPEDLMVLKAGAAPRRRLGDNALCQLRPKYEAALTEYNRLLERKSRILKERFETPAFLDILPEYNRQLCRVGALLISYRARFYEGLALAAKRYHDSFSGQTEDFWLQYKTVSNIENPFVPVKELENKLREHMESHYRAELDSAQCLTGPHKDDFDVTLSGLSLKSYGSQGQVRTAAISLKLAQRDLMQKQSGQMPVLLLDDVLSELDPGRQDFVLNHITQGQVFITCCEPGRFTKLGKTIQVQKGTIV